MFTARSEFFLVTTECPRNITIGRVLIAPVFYLLKIWKQNEN
jgi:hypothetical protein